MVDIDTELAGYKVIARRDGKTVRIWTAPNKIVACETAREFAPGIDGEKFDLMMVEFNGHLLYTVEQYGNRWHGIWS